MFSWCVTRPPVEQRQVPAPNINSPNAVGSQPIQATSTLVRGRCGRGVPARLPGAPPVCFRCLGGLEPARRPFFLGPGPRAPCASDTFGANRTHANATTDACSLRSIFLQKFPFPPSMFRARFLAGLAGFDANDLCRVRRPEDLFRRESSGTGLNLRSPRIRAPSTISSP